MEALKARAYDPLPLVVPNPGTIVNPIHRALIEPCCADFDRFRKLVEQNKGKTLDCPFPVLHALGNELQEPESTRNLRGNPNVGIAVFENTKISDRAVAAAKSFDLICTISHWTREILEARGLTNVRTIRQGVDPTIFHPAPTSGMCEGRFAVFSGGKIEFRKGQDIVVAAFKRFRERHPDALLLTAWQWAAMQYHPAETAGFLASGHVSTQPPVRDGRPDVGGWLLQNDLPPDSFVDMPPFPNALFGQVVREADVALFPNRCEGGTNMVAMEALACGVPCILSANTGHLDVLGDDHAYTLTTQNAVMPPTRHVGVERWGESDVDEVVETLESVYQDRAEARRRAANAVDFMRDWTWERHARELFQAVAQAEAKAAESTRP